MNSVLNLQNVLKAFCLSGLNCDFIEPVELQQYTKELEKRFGSPDLDKPRIDRMIPALRRILDKGDVESARDLRYICYGLAHELGPSKQRVISSEKAFSALFSRLKTLVGDTKRLRRCYQGLLAVYFEFDGRDADEPTRSNWLEVCDFLSRHLREIVSQAPVPQWATILDEHKNLFEENPCKRYAKDLLCGNADEFESVRDGLAISDTSWVFHEAAFSAIRDACALVAHDAFAKHVPVLTDLLEAHPLIQSRGLAEVLSRYSKITGQPEHKGLLDLSVRLWHNPLFSRNLVNWDCAGPAATQMVAAWLKSSLIEDFFELLSDDGKMDKRRVHFWQRYVDSIDNMYFALGRRAMVNRDPDIAKLRRTMGDNLLQLEGGSTTNNGFFMLMGDRVIAEFGEAGNAVYFFRRDSMPFELTGRINGTGRTEWRDLPGAHYLSHKDNVHGHYRWEQRFEEVLRLHLKIGPTPSPTRPVALAPRRSFPENVATTAPPTLSVDLNEIRRFCARYGIRCSSDQVHRTMSVFAGTRIPLISNYLKANGFTLHTSKLFWERKF